MARVHLNCTTPGLVVETRTGVAFQVQVPDMELTQDDFPRGQLWALVPMEPSGGEQFAAAVRALAQAGPSAREFAANAARVGSAMRGSVPPIDPDVLRRIYDHEEPEYAEPRQWLAWPVAIALMVLIAVVGTLACASV
jgi:hypothetical protein